MREWPPSALRVKPSKGKVDTCGVAIVLGGFAVLLLACGLGLFGLGIGMSVDGDLAPGLLASGVGALSTYGALLFAGAFRRVRVAVRTGSGVSRGRALKVALASTSIGLAGMLAAPIPGTEKAIGIVVFLLGTVVGFAAIADPAKDRNRS